MIQMISFKLRAFSLVFAILFFGISANAMDCNGSSNLCNKRFSEITFPTAHNAQSYIPTLNLPKTFYLLPFQWTKDFTTRFSLNVNDQDLSLRLQLYKGIRAMKLRIMPVNNIPYVCHGLTDGVKNRIENHFCKNLPFGLLRKDCGRRIASADPCFVDPSAVPLIDVLTEIKNYLSENPFEVVTIFFENYFSDFEKLTGDIVSSGLASFTYNQNKRKPWPKLKEMISSKKRLVLFINTESDALGRKLEDYPHFNSSHEFVWSSRYHFANVSDLINDDPYTNDLTPKAFVERTHPPFNKLWVLQHFITPSIAGSPIYANEVNKAPILKVRIEKYEKLVGTKPNFIWVDFFELPKEEPGYLDVINQLNQK